MSNTFAQYQVFTAIQIMVVSFQRKDNSLVNNSLGQLAIAAMLDEQSTVDALELIERFCEYCAEQSSTGVYYGQTDDNLFFSQLLGSSDKGTDENGQ